MSESAASPGTKVPMVPAPPLLHLIERRRALIFDRSLGWRALAGWAARRGRAHWHNNRRSELSGLEVSARNQPLGNAHSRRALSEIETAITKFLRRRWSIPSVNMLS